jgi:hypothetical protein
MRWLWVVSVLFLAGCQDPDRGEKVKDVPTGYTGKARVNPYLAAELYLTKKGWSAKSSRTWTNYDYETSIIFMPVSFLQTKGMGIRALDWVSNGGTLILTVEGGEPARNDFTASSSGDGVPYGGQFTGMDYVFEELGVEVETVDWSDFSDAEKEEDGHLNRSWHVTRLEEHRGGLHFEQEGQVALSIANGWNWDLEVGGFSRMVGIGYGNGEVMVLAHARPLRSPYLARSDHAAFLEKIADDYGNGNIVFLYGSGNSFFGLLWKEGRMVVIAGLLLLVAWLWMRIPRFGPVLHDAFKKPKPYGEELKASARFLWHRGQIEHLLRPLRARLEKENQGDPETLYDRLAEESDLKRDEVAEALTTDPPKDPGHILKMVQKLQALLKR